jgi:hypothetical protein
MAVSAFRTNSLPFSERAWLHKKCFSDAHAPLAVFPAVPKIDMGLGLLVTVLASYPWEAE